MADLRQCTREFLREFIELYESFPCLWRIKSKEYSDRYKKAEAYECLVEKFKEIDSSANRETIVKKINSLRSVYRKELTKVNRSIKSGAGEDEIYKPSLWYFDLLHFLNDQETPRQSMNTMDENKEQVEEDMQESSDHIEEWSATSLSDISTPPFRCSQKRKRARKDDGTTTVLESVGQKLESLQAEDAFLVFGKHVANKLRDVSKSQNAIAQKLIAEILFEAEFGTLTRNHKIVDVTGQRPDGSGWPQQNMPPQFTALSSQVGPNHFSEQSHNCAPEHTLVQMYEKFGKFLAADSEEDEQKKTH